MFVTTIYNFFDAHILMFFSQEAMVTNRQIVDIIFLSGI